MHQSIILSIAATAILAATTVAHHCSDRSSFGSGTPGTGGITPVVVTTGGDPELGNGAFALRVEQGLGGAPGLLFVALTQGTVPLPDLGIDLNVLPPWFPVTFVLDHVGQPGAGTFTLPMAIPDEPSLEHLDVFAQAIVIDAGAVKGHAASAALGFKICDSQ